MCKSCGGYSIISLLATWGFFALLLNLLNVANAGVNAIWLSLLAIVAMFCCPVMNPKIANCCQPPKKKNAK